MLRRLLSSYLVLSGVVIHVALALLVLLWLYGKVVSSGVIDDVQRAIQGSLDGVDVAELVPAAPGAINPDLLRLPAGTWHKIHATDAFRRQAHGGAAFDSSRRRLMLFGSDTHRQDWDNSVRFFDVASLRWSQAYVPDDPATYRVNVHGIPVAGDGVERPWAMHTFDALAYDPVADRLIVASSPKHMSPDKPWGMDTALWQQIKRHPTWFYEIDEHRWEPMAGKPVDFFPYATTFDAARNVMLGARSGGFFELAGSPPQWKRLGNGAPKAWHTAAAYDEPNETVVVFGTNKRSNAVWQYRRGDEKAREMPTSGQRPPGGDSVPLVYYPRLQRIVALVSNQQTGLTETWLYATADDGWTRVASADLPFDIGMNYDMVYDGHHDLLLVVANLPGDPVAVWGLRLLR